MTDDRNYQSDYYQLKTFVGSDHTAAGAAELAAQAANVWLAGFDTADVDMHQVDSRLLYVPPSHDARSPTEAPVFHHVITIRYVEHHTNRAAPKIRSVASVPREQAKSRSWLAWLARLHPLATRRRQVGQTAQQVRRPSAGSNMPRGLHLGQGFVVRQWSLLSSPAATRRAFVDEATTWLTYKVERMSLRSGTRRCQVRLALLNRTGGFQTIAWQIKLAPFVLQDWQQGLRIVRDQLVSLPLAAHPRASHLEVSLAEPGDLPLPVRARIRRKR